MGMYTDSLLREKNLKLVQERFLVIPDEVILDNFSNIYTPSYNQWSHIATLNYWHQKNHPGSSRNQELLGFI
jgi:hypothetical protein